MAEVTAMRNNALPYPVYGLPYVVAFPILDADGDLVTGATGLDSEISKNGDTFADCTNEATEMATSSGTYYLSLTGTELTADVVTIIVKTSTSGGKTTTLTLYPRKLVSLRTGTCQGGAAGYMTLDASAGAADDLWNGCIVAGVLDSATEVRVITDYTGSNQQAAVTPNWNTTPDSDDTFTIYLPEGRQLPQANVTHVVGDAQSATDLKDFADAGYDPSSNKVQGVVLVDTCTTNSDMRGTDSAYTGTPPTAGAIADAVWDEATSGHTTSGTFGEQVKTDIDAILVDTAEIGSAGAGLTALASAANLSTLTGYVDTEVAAIKAKTDNLPASPAATGDIPAASAIADAVWDEAISGHSAGGSTGEALGAAGGAGDPWITALPGSYTAGQAGYILGTNLNATVSSRATQTSVDTIDGIVDDILVDTAVIGAAGAGLTAIPWNAAWDAEVQSECKDALDGVSAVSTTLTGMASSLSSIAISVGSIDTAVGVIDGIVDNILADTGTDGVKLDLTQAVPTSNTAQTVGDTLNAARAQGFGKWVKSGTTLTLYANDGTTTVKSFTLDDADEPTSRTPA